MYYDFFLIDLFVLYNMDQFVNIKKKSWQARPYDAKYSFNLKPQVGIGQYVVVYLIEVLQYFIKVHLSNRWTISKILPV